MIGRQRGAIVIAITVLVFAAVFVFVPPIAQPEDYHSFADARTFVGVPRAWDVLSNLGFLLVGVMGLKFLLSRDSEKAFLDSRERWPYAVLFVGVLLTCFGSGYYHLAPDDARLVWDRLPMTLGFMGLVSAIIAERVSVKLGVSLLAPLLALGIFSVVYWRMTNDLRLYAIVQFYPALLMPLLLALYPKRYSGNRYLALAAVGYVAAKILEAEDKLIFGVTRNTVSGHTLKHLAAAFGVWFLLRMLRKRHALAVSVAENSEVAECVS